MILTYEQADRFYTLINALLGYANERFEVVRELPLPIVDLESQSKAALVAETLWDSVGIIDDFVRENPFDLPKRFLDTALAWKDALTGSFVFMGHEDGRALLMGDEDVFAVAGIQLEPSELLDEWPDVVRATLLPFDDLIVYDGMLNVLGIEFNSEAAASAQADFKERRAKGLVRTAADFVARSRALNEAGRNRAVERLLADAERDARIAAFGEQLPRASIAARSLGFRRPNALRLSTNASTRGTRGASSRRRPSCGNVPWTASRPARSGRAWSCTRRRNSKASAGRSALRGSPSCARPSWPTLSRRASPRRPSCCAICWPRAPRALSGRPRSWRAREPCRSAPKM